MKFVKYILLSFLAIFAFTSVMYAQAPPFAWGTVVGGTGDDEARAVAPTSDGGYIVAGFTNSTDGDVAGLSHGGYDYLVVKFNADGNVAWKKTYGGSKDDKAYAITPTSDNGYIVAGTSGSNDGDITGDNHGGNDFWVVKIDPVGTIQWAKSYGGSKDDDASGIIQTATNNGYVIAGYSNSTDGDNSNGSGSYDYWVVRTDNNGAIQWNQVYGGHGVDKAFAIARAQDGGYFVTGICLSSGSMVGGISGSLNGTNHGEGDCLIIKIDTGGTLLWNLLTGGSGVDQGNGIFGTPDNGCIVAISTSSPGDGDLVGLTMQGGNDGWVIKMDASGNKTWSKIYGGEKDDYVQSITPTNDGGYALAGYTISEHLAGAPPRGQNDYWLFRIDGTGNLTWQGTYGGGGSDFAYGVTPTSDTGYVVAGYTNSNDSGIVNHVSGGSPTNDMWVMKAGGPVTHTAVDEQVVNPATLSLNIFPNPSGARATFSFDLPDAENIEVSIYNMLGEKMQTVASGMQMMGSHTLTVNLNGYNAGVYLCRVQSAAGSATKLLEIVK